jgi:uncharacterized membrane-anchored protein
MTGFYWPSIGIVTGGAVVAAFVMGLMQRQWSLRALYVSIGSLVIAILHMVAPFRATLDPDYPGYSFGLITLERGALVGAVAGFFYLLSFASTVIAIRNRDGPGMWVVAALSAFVLLNLGGYMLAALSGLVPPYRIELGQYFQLSPLPATVLAAAVMLLPFAIGLRWSVEKSRAA